MPDNTTIPDPFSYGMAYERAKRTGIFCLEPEATPIPTRTVVVGEPPKLDPVIKAKLLGETTLPEEGPVQPALWDERAAMRDNGGR